MEVRKSGEHITGDQKKIWYLHLSCLEGFFEITFIFAFVSFISFILLVVGGLWTGLSCLIILLLFAACSLRSKRVTEEFFYKSPPLTNAPLILDEQEKYKKEIINIESKYMREIHPKDTPLKELFLFSLTVIALTMINPYFYNDQVIERIVMGAMVGFCFFGLSYSSRAIRSLWMAKNPRRISKYFGIPEWKWNVNRWQIPRSPYANAVAWLFVGIAALVLYSGITLMIRGATNVSLPIPFLANLGGGPGTDIVLGFSFAFLAFFPVLTAYWIRKMLKAGPWLALAMTMVSLFTGTLLMFDSVAGTNVFGASFYTSIPITGVSLVAIILIKLSWREFVEDRWTAFQKYARPTSKK